MPAAAQAPKSAQKPAAAPGQKPAGAAPAAAAGGGDAALRGMNYQQGRDAVKPAAVPGLPQTGPEALQAAQKSVQGGSVGATLDEGSTAYRDQDIEVMFDAGSKMNASLGWGGLRFSCDPGILVKVRNAPDVRINSIGWNFDSAKFTANVASDGFDLFGIIGKIGKWKVESVLEQKLKPLLPAAVQQAGYSPNRDPDLSGTIAQMQKMFEFSSAVPGQGGGMAQKLSAPSASLNVGLPEDFRVDLGDSGLELVIAKGTPLDLSAQGAGKLAQPVIEQLTLRAGDHGIQVLPKEGAFKDFKELDLHGVTIKKGGAFSFDYDLSAEGAINGLVALGELLGLAAGAQISPEMPNIKLDGIRKEIDAKLQSEVPPRFQQLLKQYDGLVPGFSLKSLSA